MAVKTQLTPEQIEAIRPVVLHARRMTAQLAPALGKGLWLDRSEWLAIVYAFEKVTTA